VFERFSEPSRRVVVLAQEQARALDHNYIGTEHLLLGLLTNAGSIAASILEGAGVSYEPVRRDVEERIGRGGSAPAGHIPFTPRAKKSLERALRAALDASSNEIRSPHVLLGVLHDRNGVACQTLVALGVDVDQLVAACRARAGEEERAAAPAAAAPLGEGWEPVRVTAEVRAEATAVRRDVATAGPLCHRCDHPLRDNLLHQDLPVASVTGRQVTLSIVFCGRCGIPLETVLIDEPGA
jgi:ATP-dependent Clp protease ATP-binding subunit ClpC